MSRRLLQALLRTDFNTFVEKAYAALHEGAAIQRNWHIEAIAWQLNQVAAGECHRCIITQPPRSLKSIVTTVAFVAWMLGRNPALKFICVSYSKDLTAEHARLFRRLVTSTWYREAFPGTCADRDTDLEFATTRGGGRFATSIGGTLTGRGADIIIIDDPIKAEEAQSASAREAVIHWYRNTLVTRLNDKRRGSIILVMQRLHEDDLAGYLLSQQGWAHLNLPAVAVEDQHIALGRVAVHHRIRGDVLHPEREPEQALMHIRQVMGDLQFSAQYQQKPIPLEGNVIKRQWFQTYDIRPPGGPGSRVIQSWDVATTVNNSSDFSVCTTWLVRRKKYYLIDVLRIRLEYPDLRRRVIDMAVHHSANAVLVENAGVGMSLIQDLRTQRQPRVPVPIPRRPDGDKQVRMAAQSARIEAGQVYLPADAPWLAEFMNELLGFPNSKHDDQVDSVSQFLKWITQYNQPEFAPVIINR